MFSVQINSFPIEAGEMRDVVHLVAEQMLEIKNKENAEIKSKSEAETGSQSWVSRTTSKGPKRKRQLTARMSAFLGLGGDSGDGNGGFYSSKSAKKTKVATAAAAAAAMKKSDVLKLTRVASPKPGEKRDRLEEQEEEEEYEELDGKQDDDDDEDYNPDEEEEDQNADLIRDHEDKDNQLQAAKFCAKEDKKEKAAAMAPAIAAAKAEKRTLKVAQNEKCKASNLAKKLADKEKAKAEEKARREAKKEAKKKIEKTKRLAEKAFVQQKKEAEKTAAAAAALAPPPSAAEAAAAAIAEVSKKSALLKGLVASLKASINAIKWYNIGGYDICAGELIMSEKEFDLVFSGIGTAQAKNGRESSTLVLKSLSAEETRVLFGPLIQGLTCTTHNKPKNFKQQYRTGSAAISIHSRTAIHFSKNTLKCCVKFSCRNEGIAGAAAAAAAEEEDDDDDDDHDYDDDGYGSGGSDDDYWGGRRGRGSGMWMSNGHQRGYCDYW